MGAAFAPDHVSLTYSEADGLGLPADSIGCPVHFERRLNRIVFRSDWLDQAAHLGNNTSYPMVVALCDNLLDELKLRVGIAGEIRALLLRDIANPPTLADVAKVLDISDRPLRRQLRQQGISFRGLLDELRTHTALKYLRTTKLANADIALALGFTTPQIFRRAFHHRLVVSS
ncbi:helix-turn-helix domain-containing protein [Bradyrhizobium sp. UFLA05-112]